MDFIFFGNTDKALFDITSLAHIVAGVCIAMVLFLMSREYKLLRLPENFIMTGFMMATGWEFLELFGRFMYPYSKGLVTGYFFAPVIDFFTSTESYFNIVGDVMSDMVGLVVIFYIFKNQIMSKI